MNQLTVAEKAELHFLRRQVDIWQEERYRKGGDSSAAVKYELAKNELTNFVSKLRSAGKRI